MEDKGCRAAENCCAICGFSLPEGAETCPECSETRVARKIEAGQSSKGDSESVSELRTAEGSVRRSVAMGLLAREEGDLLLLLLTRGHLLEFSAKSALCSLIRQTADERCAQKREDRAHILVEFVASTMPTEDLAKEVTRVFQLM